MDPLSTFTTKAVSVVCKAAVDTLKEHYQKYKVARYEEFLQYLDVTYDRGTVEAKQAIEDFIDNPSGRSILGERMESIMSTDSKRILMIQALLLCKDPETWPGESIEKRIIFALQNMTDEILAVFKYSNNLREHPNNSSSFQLHVLDKNSDLTELEDISSSRVVAIIEDLKRRGLFIPDISSMSMGINFGAHNEHWAIVFGETEESKALLKLLKKAEFLLE